jgi:hypothetical protein
MARRLATVTLVVALLCVALNLAAIPRAAAGEPSLEQIQKKYGGGIAAELTRVWEAIAPRDRWVTVIYAEVYLQCIKDFEDDLLFCESASPESLPWVASILTPDKQRRLAELGFRPPGYSINYSRFVTKAMVSSGEAAKLILQTLYDVYGYRDQEPLLCKTETGEHLSVP